MGKYTGFMEYDRTENLSVPPEERIKSFSEFHPMLDKEKRRLQGARCMNCGVPFCQSGTEFGGMVSGCPLHNLIPEWNDEIYNGNWKQALVRLLKTNNFPEFTGRVCPALCEAACTCGLNADPVTVRDNELAVIEEGFAEGLMSPSLPSSRSGKNIAVVGAGPAGLAAADMLNKRGHNVTVYEREKKPGGLLMYGIPNMKLDKSVIDRRIRLMEAEGINFALGIDIGKDIASSELEKRYDAVVLCCGAKKPRDLSVKGRSSKGIYFAVDFLSDVTREIIGESKKAAVSATGKDVIVVGGGDTGNDCVGTCIRQGCKSVIQLEMMPKLPDSRKENNLWPQWPRVCKTDYGQQEAIAVFGKDPRIYQTTVKEIISEKGRITGIKTVQLEFVKDEKTGRIISQEISGSEKILPCGLLLIAAGFVGCEDYAVTVFKLNKTARGCIEVIDGGYSAGGKLFAAGDCRRGQSLVVWAIAEGRACACEVDKFLMGYSNM